MLAQERYGSDLLGLHFEEAGRYPLLSNEEIVELFTEIEKGDARARELVINSNLRLVLWWARKYSRRNMEFADVVQEGYFGLLHAITKYDWRRGFTFSTYASHWIQQRIRRAIADKSRAIRLPVHIHEKVGKFRRAATALSQELMREPTREELAESMKLTETEMGSLDMALAARTVSINTPVGEDASLADFISDRTDVIEQAINRRYNSELRGAILRSMARLSERERKVLVWRFGLDGREPMTLVEVGFEVGLTRERIRQIEVEALRKLHDAPPLEAFAPIKQGRSSLRRERLRKAVEGRKAETGYVTSVEAVESLGLHTRYPLHYVLKLRRNYGLAVKETVGNTPLFDIEEVSAANQRKEQDNGRSLPVSVRMMTEEELARSKAELQKKQEVRDQSTLQKRIEKACRAEGLVTTEQASLAFGIPNDSMNYRLRYYRKLGRIEPVRRVGQIPLYRLDDINTAFGRRYETARLEGGEVVQQDLVTREEAAHTLGWTFPTPTALAQRFIYMEKHKGLKRKSERPAMYLLDEVKAAEERKQGRAKSAPHRISMSEQRSATPASFEPVKSVVLHELVGKGPLPDLSVLISENGEAPFVKVVEYTLAVLRRSPTIANLRDERTQKHIILELAGLR